MKRIKLALCVLILCLVGCIACSSGQKPSQAHTSSQSSGQAQTSSPPGSEIGGTPPVTGVNTNFFSSPESIDNAGVWKAVKQAQIPALRFPGGTRGNFYDWRTGRIRPAGRAGSEPVERGRPVPMDDFMSRARSAGASVSYVLDITDSPASIRQLARHWKKTNAPVRWVEMGNEYYSRDQIRSIGGPAGYLEKARQALRALRAGGYEGPVGLVVAPEGVLGGGDSITFRIWNRILAASDLSGFNAIVLHYYPRTEQVGFRRVYKEGPSNLRSVIGNLRKRFPGKQIWITEWNLGPPANAPQFNTMWHALFDLRMMKAMLDSHVELAFYHVLTGRGWELLGPASQHGGSVANLSRRVPYFAFQMVDEARSGGAKYAPDIKAFKGVEHMAFRTRDQLRVLAWAAGRENKNLRLQVDRSSPTFLNGELLHGGLSATNGSSLRMTDATSGERVRPHPINSTRLKGPGAVLLRFSLRGGSG